MMPAVSSGPPWFLVVAAVVSTLAAVAAVLFFVVRTIRREQRGFDVKPPEDPAPSPRDPGH